LPSTVARKAGSGSTVGSFASRRTALPVDRSTTIGGAMEHHGFEGHDFEGHDFDRHHFEGRGFGFGPVFPYYAPYYSPYGVAPSPWYYCPSYGEYYPNVTSCPEPWVTVPAE